MSVNQYNVCVVLEFSDGRKRRSMYIRQKVANEG